MRERRDEAAPGDDRSFAEQVHGHLLGRAVDPATLRHMLEALASGTSRDVLAAALSLTAQWPEVPGAPAAPGPAPPSLAQMLACSDAEFVTQAFRQLLGRSPDLAGALIYLRALKERKSRLAILLALRFSDESLAHSTWRTKPWTVREMLRSPAATWTERTRLLLLFCRQRLQRRA